VFEMHERPRSSSALTLTPTLTLTLALLSASCSSTDREPIVGRPCEGCEAIFDGLPETLDSRARIAPVDEPGTPLEIAGRVVDREGRAVAGIVIYAYHTDARGIYPPDLAARTAEARRHGRLRAWVRSDSEGRFAFSTIRPGGYPDTDLPEHVHLHVLEPGRCTYYVDDLMFADDPRLTAEKRQALDLGRGGSGIATPEPLVHGGWRAERTIVLGARIPGYP
jgi:protocatechuate 3,4-dioxygenase beta subunit